MQLRGVITALITPFQEGELDEAGLRENIWFQLEEGISGLLALGTTGELPTLTLDEQERVMRIVIQEAKGKVPVLINVGDNCTQRTIEKAKQAEKWGADFLLAVTPYYNRPSQEGLLRHFQALAAATALPILLYHHPARTGVSLTIETLLRLAEIPNIVGIKEASGNLSLVCQSLHHLPETFSLFSGEDFLTFPLVALGAKGVISILSNLMPTPLLEMINLLHQGQLEEARKWHEKLFPFCELSTLETNPVPIKTMMQLAQMPAGPCRLPLSPLSAENLARLKSFFLESPLIPQAVYE